MLIGNEKCLGHRRVTAEHSVDGAGRASPRAAENGRSLFTSFGCSLLSRGPPRRNGGNERRNNPGHRKETQPRQTRISAQNSVEEHWREGRNNECCMSGVSGQEAGYQAEIR